MRAPAQTPAVQGEHYSQHIHYSTTTEIPSIITMFLLIIPSSQTRVSERILKLDIHYSEHAPEILDHRGETKSLCNRNFTRECLSCQVFGESHQPKFVGTITTTPTKLITKLTRSSLHNHCYMYKTKSGNLVSRMVYLTSGGWGGPHSVVRYIGIVNSMNRVRNAEVTATNALYVSRGK